jgi:hypothetical protein
MNEWDRSVPHNPLYIFPLCGCYMGFGIGNLIGCDYHNHGSHPPPIPLGYSFLFLPMLAVDSQNDVVVADNQPQPQPAVFRFNIDPNANPYPFIYAAAYNQHMKRSGLTGAPEFVWMRLVRPSAADPGDVYPIRVRGDSVSARNVRCKPLHPFSDPEGPEAQRQHPPDRGPTTEKGMGRAPRPLLADVMVQRGWDRSVEGRAFVNIVHRRGPFHIINDMARKTLRNNQPGELPNAPEVRHLYRTASRAGVFVFVCVCVFYNPGLGERVGDGIVTHPRMHFYYIHPHR